MVSISLCMIVKNEEDVIARCLDSIADLVDEIIIVDTGSTDATKEIASRYTPKIYDFEWIDDFAAARNYAFAQSSRQYNLWLDADDVVLENDRQKFARIKANLTPGIHVVEMRYNTSFDENGNVTFSFYRERIIKNNAGMRWVGAIHEVIEVIGEKVYSECAITHQKLHPTDPDRNLNIFEKLIANDTPLDFREQFYYGRELYYHASYEKAIAVFEAFLDAENGWIENIIDACKYCAYCYYGLNRSDDALSALLRTLRYDLPRAEICCDIGRHFFDRDQYSRAIFWYKLACACPRKDDNGGFISPDCYNFTPLIQLCVCYSRIGNLEKAKEYNEKSALYKPDSDAVAKNRIYFANLK